METLSSRAFTRTSAGERFKKPATLSTGMPCRSVSLRKNKSALSTQHLSIPCVTLKLASLSPIMRLPAQGLLLQYKPSSK